MPAPAHLLLLCTLGLSSLQAVVLGASWSADDDASAAATPLTARRSLLTAAAASIHFSENPNLLGTYFKGANASRFSLLWSSQKLPAKYRQARPSSL